MKGKLAERKGRGQQGCPGDFIYTERGPGDHKREEALGCLMVLADG
jgi:hypothetical protein